MGRAVYPHELTDPDFSWLITRYQETNPSCFPIESTSLPLVFVMAEGKTAEADESLLLPVAPAVSLPPKSTHGNNK